LQMPPLTVSNISLLFILGAIILIITAEFISQDYGPTNLIINRKRLRQAAFAMGIVFFMLLAITLYNLFSAA